MMRRLAALATCALAISCTADTGDAVVPELGAGGKADASDHVAMRGELEIGTTHDDAFVEDLEFHGYTIDVREGAELTIELTHAGSSSKLDATLFVYGPRTDAGFGDTAIAFDDDSGWGRLPRLRDLGLDEGGEYLVVVGTHDARGRGRYRLRTTCESGECSAPPSCIFGAFLIELLESTRIEITSHVVLHASDLPSLDALAQAQIVDAMHESVHDDVTTAAEAFERADQHEINEYQLRDRVTDRTYTFFEYGSGDNSFGRVYASGTTDVVVVDHDTDLMSCTELD